MKFWIILFWLALIFTKESNETKALDPKKPRKLRGTRSGSTSRTTTTTRRTATTTSRTATNSRAATTSRSAYTAPSSYTRSYGGNGGVYTYSSYANPVVYTNAYWNVALGRTS